LYYLLDIERDTTSLAKEQLLSAHQIRDKHSRVFLLCEQLIGFLFQEKANGQLEIHYDTVINHFPQLKAGKVTLHGVGSLLNDISLGELRTAVEEMQAYFDGKEEESLSRMIACLYRPLRRDWEAWKLDDRFDGRKREPFNRAKLDDLSLITARLNQVERTGILLWFSHTLSYIQKEDLLVSGREVNFSVLFPGSSGESGEPLRPDQRGSGWTGLLYQIAEQRLFGAMEETDRSGFFDILIYLYDKHLENQKQKAKLNSRKK
jgi:hypothetical protein